MEAIATAYFIRNRLVTKRRRESCTPNEIICGKRPILVFIRTFGSKAFAYNPKEERQGKFHSSAKEELCSVLKR